MPAKTTRIKKNKETFQLEAPAAATVLLAGDFTGWDESPIELKKSRDGMWKATIALTPGQHEYRFMVDGIWCDDPQAEQRIANGFGSTNCVRAVTAG